MPSGAAEKASSARCTACVALFLNLVTAALVGAALYYGGTKAVARLESLEKSGMQNVGQLAADVSSLRETSSSLSARLARAEEALAALAESQGPTLLAQDCAQDC